MISEEQTQAIRNRLGITPVTDIPTVDRGAELKSAWNTPEPSAMDVAGQGVVDTFKQGGERVMSEISKIGHALPSETPVQAAIRQPIQVAKTLGTASVETIKGAGSILAAPFVAAWQKLPQETRDSLGSTFDEGVKAIVHNLPEPAQQTLVNIAQKLKDRPDYAEIAQDSIDLLFNTAALNVGGNVKSLDIQRNVGTAITEAGNAIKESGLNSLDTQKIKFSQDLVSPIKTKAVKEAEVARTSETGVGPLKRSVITPTEEEQRAAEAVAHIPAVSPSATYQQNYNAISDYNSTVARTLEHQLIQDDFVFPRKELKSRLNDVRTSLANNPALVGDSEKTATKLIAHFENMLDSVPAKGSNLLQLRKDFDAWVESQKGDKAFDPKTDNAFSIALREVRHTVNDFLDEKATSVRVKPLLAEQRALYTALDNITPKAAEEADTAIGRAFQNMARVVGIKNKTVQEIAALAGIGGLGAAATFAPAATATLVGGFTTYQAGKLILKPQLRIVLGNLLKEGGTKIADSDRAVIEQWLAGGAIVTPAQMQKQPTPKSPELPQQDQTDWTKQLP